MDQRLIVSFESVKEDRKYALHIPMGAPAQEVYDFAQEVSAYLIEVSKKNAEKAVEAPINPEIVDPVQAQGE